MTPLKALPTLPKLSRQPKAKTNDCSCGCGQKTASRFVPGHDSRLRGWMLRLERGLVKATDIPDGERQAAVAALAKAGGHVTPHTKPTQLVGATTDRKLAKRQAREERAAAASAGAANVQQ